MMEVFGSDGGGGHTILNDNGTSMTQRSKLQFRGLSVQDNAENDATVVSGGIKIYGFRHDMANVTDTLTNITYIAGTENENYQKMMTNEGEGTATPGSWGNFLSDVLYNKPAMVKKDGTLDYWLDPDDYTKKLDGTASDYNNLNYTGAGAFAWIQKAYMKEEYTNNGDTRDVYFAFGGKPNDDYHPVGFLCADGELEGVWIPMGYMDASGRTLVAGTTPIDSKTCQQEKAIIDTIGTRARFYGGAITNFMRDLMYMLFKSTDIQKYGGYGRCNDRSQQVIANANVANGNVVGFKGTGDKKTMNKAFHSQLLFSYQQYCRDPYTLLVNGALKYSDNYEYDISGGTYKIAGDTTWSSLNGGWHYGSHLEKSGDSFGSTPKKENNASTSTGLCDGLYCNTSGVRVARRFGYCNGDLISGPGCLLLADGASSAYWYSGVGVLLLPPVGYDPKTNTNPSGQITDILGDLADVEASTKASRAYSVGEYLVYNNLLYKVTEAITSGGTITPGTNASQTTVGDELCHSVVYEYTATKTETVVVYFTTHLHLNNDIGLSDIKFFQVCSHSCTVSSNWEDYKPISDAYIQRNSAGEKYVAFSAEKDKKYRVVVELF